jgi:hypothetical protein
MSTFSASSGIEMPGARVDVNVTEPSPGTAVCSLTCNGRNVVLTFAGDGDVDVNVEPQA